MDWKSRALLEVQIGRADPDHVPRFRVLARHWWQFWKPRWSEIEGASVNEIRRAHGLDALPSYVKITLE